MSIHQANEYITSEIDIKRYTIHHCKSELYESEIMHRQPWGNAKKKIQYDIDFLHF